jgi:hypothetical protein
MWWDDKLVLCPEFTLRLEDVVSGENLMQKMQSCPVKMTSDPMIWNEWVKVKRASNNESSEDAMEPMVTMESVQLMHGFQNMVLKWSSCFI